MTTTRKAIGSRRIPLHDHSDLNSGGQLGFSQAIAGGLEVITGSIPPPPDDTSSTGSDTPFDHDSMGATETLDITQGTWHRGTLTADCAITVQGFAADEGVVIIFEVTQDGTGGWDITWDSDVEFTGNSQPSQTALSVSIFVLFSSAGDTTIYGSKVGGVAALDDLTDVAITGGALGDILRHNGTTWVDYAGHYEPVVHDFGSGAEIVFDNGDIVMEWFD